jgi:hypothetical protein
VRGLRSQSRALSNDIVYRNGYAPPQQAAPVSPERSAWTGGHETEPKEQNTQQSPCFGRSVAPQPVQL